MFGSQMRGQQFLRALRQAFGPAELLNLKAVDLNRQFGRAFQARKVGEFPSLDLRAIAEIGIFGERVVLPAARVFDHGGPQ